MIQLYFRDVRRCLERLEKSRPKPIDYRVSWVDEDGRVTMIAGPNYYWELDEDESEDEDGRLDPAGFPQPPSEGLPGAAGSEGRSS